MADLDPIELELNWNSKEFMAEFQRFLAGGKDADKALDSLKSKFEQITKAQAGAAKENASYNGTLQQFGNTVKTINENFDDFGLDKENISIQKQVIKEIEAELKALNKQISQVAPGKAQQALILEAREITAELENEKKALQEVENAFKSNKEGARSLSNEYETNLARLRELALANQQGSQEYRELLDNVTLYRQQIQGLNEDLQDATRSSFSAFLGVLTLVSSGLSVAQGVMGLFASENENLERIMVRVQSLMAITIGLQEITDALSNRNAASTRALVAVQNIWATVNTRVTASLVAMGMAQAAAAVTAQILIGTLTLGLSVAIAALLVWFDKWQEEQKKVEEAQKRMSQAVADNAAEQVIAYKKLQIQWNSLGDDLKSKEKFINGNQDAFKKLGVEVTNVSDAENVLQRNTQAFVEAMMARAEAAAAAQLAQEKFKEYLLKRNEEDEKLSNPTIGQNIGQWWQMGVLGKSTEDYINKIHEDSDELKKEYQDYIQLVVDSEKRKDEIYKKYGFKEYLGKETKAKKPKKDKELHETFNDGSVLKLQNQILLLDGALQRMGKNGEVRLRAFDKYGKQHATKEIIDFQTALNMRLKLVEQHAEAERKIRLLRLTDSISEMENDWGRYYKYQKEFGTKAAQELFSGLRNEGMSYYEWLTSQKDKLAAIVSGGGILTEEQKKALEIINQKTDELSGQQSEFQLFTEKTERQLAQIPSISEQIDYLIEQRDALKNEGVDKGFYAFLDLQVQQKTQKFKLMMADFLATHTSFEVQKTNITDRYEKMRESLEKNKSLNEGDRSQRLAALNREQNQELAAITSAKFEREHLENDMAVNLLNITTTQLKNRISTIKEFLNAEITLTKEQKEKLKEELQKAEGLLKNPEQNRDEQFLIDRKATILKQINSLKADGNKLNVVENGLVLKLLQELEQVNGKLKETKLDKLAKVAEWASVLTGAFGDLVESIDDSNSGLAQTLQLISELGSDVGSVIKAFQKGLVEGIVSLVVTVLKWIGKLFTMGKAARESEKKAQAEMQAHQDKILQSQLEYNAELRKRISDEIKLNDLYKSRVDNIKEEMDINKKNAAQILKDQQMVFNRLLNSSTVTEMYTKKYGGFFGMGRKTKTVEISKTIAELLGIGSYLGNPLHGQPIFVPGQVELTDDLFDKLEKLNSMMPLTGDAKTAFDQLKKLRDEYGSITELNRQLEIEMKNTVTGTTASALADSIREGLKSGKKSFADFAGDIENFLRDAILAGISAKTIEPKIQELQDAFADMMGDGILSQEERTKFQEMYMAIVKESQDYMDIINEAGIDLTGGNSGANSLQGAIKAMSQESADILAGQFGGLRLAQLETNQILKSGAAQQLAQSSKMIELQMDIEKNTRRTAENTEKIHDVNDNVVKVVNGQNKYYQALQAAGIIT